MQGWISLEVDVSNYANAFVAHEQVIVIKCASSAIIVLVRVG